MKVKDEPVTRDLYRCGLPGQKTQHVSMFPSNN